MCFGAIERSVEAYAVAEGGDERDDFHDHTTCYDRATELGLLSRETTQDLRQLYDTNRTDNYYGGRRPTEQQADTMQELAHSGHEYVTDQIREGGVCVCDSLDGSGSLTRVYLCLSAAVTWSTLFGHALGSIRPQSVDSRRILLSDRHRQ